MEGLVQSRKSEKRIYLVPKGNGGCDDDNLYFTINPTRQENLEQGKGAPVRFVETR
jgi:hypothetical protein